MQLFLSTQKNSEQSVKPCKMIHVRMRDKNMRQLENIPGGKGVDIAEIEHNGPVFEQETDEQGRIFKRSVNEPGK